METCNNYDDWCEAEKRNCTNCYYEKGKKRLILIFKGKAKDFISNNFIIKE